MEINSLINLTAGRPQMAYRVLKESQDLAAAQANRLIESLPPKPAPPSMPGIGGHLDISA